MSTHRLARREAVLLGATTGLALLVSGCGEARSAHDAKHDAEKDEDVSPAEDLMREHGVLNRLLLVYEEGDRRLSTPQAAEAIAVITSAAGIIRRFVEDYHERLEEQFLFPRFEKAGKLVDLVATLRRQHQAGRTVTERITRLATAQASDDAKKELSGALHAFVRMYRPHESREDTVLFPALPRVIPHKELEDLGEQFEETEHRLFGKDGFEGVVREVAKLEQQLGIDDLNRFTPT
jgi:hemerythrin-like domain-containing protein